MSSASATPHALILAAGIGRRLGRDAPDAHLPKCLLEFDGRSLLARHVGLLHERGITDVTVVVGYRADRIEAALDQLEGPRPATLHNPDFREGSVVSLHAGRSVLTSGRSVVLMDADVLYDYRVMRRLLNTDGQAGDRNLLLLDREIEPGDEPVKICVRDDRIVDFHKRPQAAHDWHGESVGFFRFRPDAAQALAGRVATYVADGRRGMEYEEPIRDMIQAEPDRFGFEEVTGLPWTEIDFPEDVEKARALLPLLVE